MLSIEDKNYTYENTANRTNAANTAAPKRSSFSLITFLLIAVLAGGIIGFITDDKHSQPAYESTSDQTLQQLLDNQEAYESTSNQTLQQLLENQEAQNAINQELLNRIEELKNQKEKDPVSLIGDEIKTSYNDPWNIFTIRNSLTDNVGNTYQNAYSLRASGSTNPIEITYILNGEYSSLYGSIAVDERERDSFREVWINILDENNNHIYESAHITRNNPNPIQISCDVSGLERVSVQFIGITRDGTMGVYLISEGFVLK